MSFWKTMPRGMLLRSNWTATSIAEHDGPLSLDAYCAATGPLALPLPLEHFVNYGTWVQEQVAPDVDARVVRRVDPDANGFVLAMADGEPLHARRVVVAAGIADFVHRPQLCRDLSPDFSSHTADHTDLGEFRGRRVLVVGGGQSALESAALLHESGADAEIVARASHVNWLHGGKYHRMLGRLAPLVYAPTDVGPMGLSRVVAVPNAFRRLPRTAQNRIAYRAIRPAGAAWLRPRLQSVPIWVGRTIHEANRLGSRVRVKFDDHRTAFYDHVLFGTGYRVDIARYSFLDHDFLRRIERVQGYPRLRPGMESSVPGLHFLGAPAAWTFGPVMRFVAGGWFGAQTLSHRLTETKTPFVTAERSLGRRLPQGRPQ
jgi:hypothetical protein